MTTILDTILGTKREEIKRARMQTSLTSLRTAIRNLEPPRNFVAHIQEKFLQGCPAVIAEVKKASPSKGVIRENFDPVSIALDYEAHGAACLSVLTDEQYFQGNLAYLTQIRQAVSLPLLRKDFIIDEYQIAQARMAGADCILLIVAALPQEMLKELESIAHGLGMAVLLEVHNEEELGRALQLKTPLLGINNRDLKTFNVDLKTTFNLLPHIPADRVVVTESGIAAPPDIDMMKKHNVHAFLIGEAFMRHTSPGGAMQQLFTTAYPSFAVPSLTR